MSRQDHISVEQLSAYFDGELPSHEAPVVDLHVAGCAACLKELAAMERARRAARALSVPHVPDALWSRIEDALPQSASALPRYFRPVRMWAAAAAVVLAIATGIFVTMNPYGTAPKAGEGELTTHSGFDYGLFLAALNGRGSMEGFETRYSRRETSLEEALSAVGTPMDEDLLTNVPSGLDLKAVYVLSSTSTKSMQMTYRHKGSEVTVFRQPKGHAIHFAGYQLEPTSIGGKQCLMAHDGKYCAVTIATDAAQYVIIGHRDDVMVAALIDEVVLE